MDLERSLRALIESLPRESLTRKNLLVLRDAYRAGSNEEWRVWELLSSYAQSALERRRKELMGGK